MATGESLVLGEEQQIKLGMMLVNNDLFGIREDEADYITLKSKRKSPHYLDIRQGLSNYVVRQGIAQPMADLAKQHSSDKHLGVDYVIGSPEAMTSYAASVADILEMGLLQPRVALNKESGNKVPILGRYTKGESGSAFDDVVTDGETKISTVESLQAAGLHIVDYYVVLDREEGGAPQVKEATGIDITPALGVSSLVRMLRAEDAFNQKQYDNVARYLSEFGDPHAQNAMNSAL